MTGSGEEERDLLAAEYALGLLEGDELARARQLEASSAPFAQAVAGWQERFTPLWDEIAEVQPDPSLWARIEKRLTAPSAANDNVARIEKKLRVWRGYGLGATAIAASLALVVGIQSQREPPSAVEPQRPEVLLASLASEGESASLSVAYDRRANSLLVKPGRLAGIGGRAHELWIIPAGGTPISLGLISGTGPQRLSVGGEAAGHFRPNAAIAVSVEPSGGSPTGAPTGPVIAAGELLPV